MRDQRGEVAPSKGVFHKRLWPRRPHSYERAPKGTKSVLLLQKLNKSETSRSARAHPRRHHRRYRRERAANEAFKYRGLVGQLHKREHLFKKSDSPTNELRSGGEGPAPTFCNGWKSSWSSKRPLFWRANI